ncbi:anti-sigma B factor RsbW [Paenibacillus tarimensis]|uniref:anti-sigma B factor RsbW n=1 Tax=Paenibacillus tarimensis TaxID=416012 RepID=UPI001F4890C1|nr:anti-sigma B factor RsbW [Paenibacillus tarimensis]MCF2943639.1 anti-sigma B factor RsbW [Paenibacillus tarimensis]
MKATDELIKLQLPASAEYVDLVRVTLYGIAAKMGFSYEEIEDMKVAVSEACNNAVLHAYGNHPAGTTSQAPEEQPRMEVRFIKKQDALSIVVKDEGESFDALAVARQKSPMHGKSIDQLTAGGLGLYLMQALMDQVEVHSDAGTEVILTKRLVRSEDTV